MFRRIIVIGLALSLVLLSGTVYGQERKDSDPHWRASYWNNMALSGKPVLEETVEHLGFSWGAGSPHPTVNAERFSARWSRYVDLQTATYRLAVTSDDGVRIYVNDRLVIDEWNDHPARTFSRDLALQAGHHYVVVEYYEHTGVASLSFALWPLPAGTGRWQGEYYDNVTLGGSPVRTRVDDEIDFDWGYGSPAAHIPSDSFSVRWTGTLVLESGLYRFTTTTDDGVRLWVNDHLLVDEWYDQAVQAHDGTIHLSGAVPVRLEYYEQTGVATARLAWARLGDGPSPVPDEIVVDDDDPGFVKGGSAAGWHREEGGYGGRLTWTRNNDRVRPSYNWARWYPDLTAGRYEVYVHIPVERSSTSNARYWVAHRDGYTLRQVDQAEERGTWVSLGTYRFQGTRRDYVSLADVTYEPYLWRQIAFDAVKWVPR